MLAVTGALTLSELHGGLARSRRLRPLPPSEVVQRVLLAHTDFCRVGASIGLAKFFQETELLADAEAAGVDIIREATGVVGTYEFVDAMVGRGFSAARAHQILHGPFTKSPAAGVYVLRGLDPPGRLVEGKIRERRDRRRKSIVSVTRAGPRTIVATYRLARHNLDGVLTAPPQIPPDLENWEGRDHVGRRLKVTMRNNFLWGVRTWFDQESAAEGDLVVATFQTDLGRVEFDLIKERLGSDGA